MSKQVEYMESIYNQSDEVVTRLQEALNEYENILPKIKELISYYESGSWRKDYEKDQNGGFPDNLKRGVLSEDAIYNLISDIESIQEQMKDLL